MYRKATTGESRDSSQETKKSFALYTHTHTYTLYYMYINNYMYARARECGENSNN